MKGQSARASGSSQTDASGQGDAVTPKRSRRPPAAIVRRSSALGRISGRRFRLSVVSLDGFRSQRTSSPAPHRQVHRPKGRRRARSRLRRSAGAAGSEEAAGGRRRLLRRPWPGSQAPTRRGHRPRRRPAPAQASPGSGSGGRSGEAIHREQLRAAKATTPPAHVAERLTGRDRSRRGCDRAAGGRGFRDGGGGVAADRGPRPLAARSGQPSRRRRGTRGGRRARGRREGAAGASQNEASAETAAGPAAEQPAGREGSASETAPSAQVPDASERAGGESATATLMRSRRPRAGRRAAAAGRVARGPSRPPPTGTRSRGAGMCAGPKPSSARTRAAA